MIDKKERKKKLIQKEIVHEREDNFLNHVKSWWAGDGELSGMVSDDDFKVWSCSSRQSGIMHIVVQGNFTFENESLRIYLKTKVNIAGRIFMICFLLFWAIVAFVLLGNEALFLRCLLFLIFPTLFVLGYNLERKIILEAVEKIIRAG